MRFEFDGFQPVAMAGGTAAHSAIQRNILHALTGRLRGKRCQPYGADLKIEVVGRIRYPDAFAVCTPVPPRETVVTDPVVVFEVLGEGTANTDLVEKNAEYPAAPRPSSATSSWSRRTRRASCSCARGRTGIPRSSQARMRCCGCRRSASTSPWRRFMPASSLRKRHRMATARKTSRRISRRHSPERPATATPRSSANSPHTGLMAPVLSADPRRPPDGPFPAQNWQRWRQGRCSLLRRILI